MTGKDFTAEQVMCVGYGENADDLFRHPYWSEVIHRYAVELVDEDEPYLLLENEKVSRIFQVTVTVEDITDQVKEQYTDD